MTSLRSLRPVVLSLTFLLTVGVLAVIPSANAVTPNAMPATALNAMWSDYGNQGGHWTGADSTASVPLPDGRIAWLFSDTYLGTVNPDLSRPANSPLVSNSLVVQDGSALTQTLHGGTATAPKALVQTTDPNELYWVGDGTVVDDELLVFYNRYHRTGSGPLDVELAGTSLVTFALPALTVSSVRPLPLGDGIAWGAAVLEQGDQTLVYGTESVDALKFAHVAQLDRSLTGTWEFWTGSDWSSDETASGRLLSGVGTAFSVDRVGDQYVLVTQDANLLFGANIVAYTAATPTGPFSAPRYLAEAPEPAANPMRTIYDVRTHPELAVAGKLLLSYNVNTFVAAENTADVRIYRPRFIDVSWPPTDPDPSAVPGRPTGLTVTGATTPVKLSWQPVPGATGYRVYQRDVTAGQTHFARQNGMPTTSSTTVDFLSDRHTYEYRITAVNAVGEGQPSATGSITVQVAPPPAPTNLRATATPLGGVNLTWNPVPVTANYQLFRRDITAQETEFTEIFLPNPGTATASVPDLVHGHTYEFKVNASNGGGDGPASGVVQVTANYATPGTPTGLRAAAGSDGSVQLDWTAPPGNNWYWIYQRDLTGGETTYTRLEYPITEGPTARPGGLIHNHQYEFRVSAINAGGEGPQSTAVRATARYDAPETPTVLSATANADGTVQLDWTAPPGNNWYWIYQRDLTGGETTYTRLEYPITEGPTARPGGLIHNHQYEFRVSAINAGGEGPQSTAVRVTARHELPSAPTGLRVTAGDSKVELSWTAPPGNNWYWVYYRNRTAGDTEFVRGEYPVATGPAATIGLLTNGHDYEFRVTAVSAGGEGPASTVVTAKPMPALPPQTTGLTAAANTAGGIALSWTSVGPGVYYWIFRRDVTAGETTFTKIGYPTEATTTTVTPLTNGHRYEFTVLASNLAGDGPRATPVQAVAQYDPPKAPTNLRGHQAGNGTVELAWDAPALNLFYWVYRRDVTAGEATFTKGGLPAGDPQVTVGLLTAGHTYEFKVSAENAGGEGPASTTVRLTAPGGVPQPPTGVNATAGNRQVTLTWTPPPGNDLLYWVYYRDTATVGPFEHGEYPASGTSATVSGLANGRTYEFRVAAVNSAGEGGPSTTVTGRPMPPRPTAPTGLEAIGDNGIVGLGWDLNPTADTYHVYYRNISAGQTGWTRQATSIAEWWHTVRGLANGNRYEFRVSSVNAWGEGPPSVAVSATPIPPAPQAPSGLRASAGNGKVTLNWTASPTPNVYYWVYFRPQGHTNWYNFEYPTLSTSMVASPLLNGFNYEFKVTAANLGGQSGFSNTVSARPFLPLPQAPTNLQAVAGDKQVTLTWNASSTQDVYYWVYYRPQGHTNWSYFNLPTLRTSTVAAPLLNGFTYEFKVTAANQAGQSGYSNTIAARPLPPRPSVPSLAAWVDIYEDRVNISWNSGGHTDGLHFWIEYCTCARPGSTWQRVGWPVMSTPGQNGYRWSAHTGMFGYHNWVYFRIVAVNFSGTSYSNVEQVKAWPPPENVYTQFTTPTVAGWNSFWNAKNNQGDWSVYGFNWGDDGCSAPLVGDRPLGVFNFRAACVRHDFGYRNHRKVRGMSSDGHRERIDYTLKWDLERYCRGESFLEDSCMQWAYYFHIGVRGFGEEHWWSPSA